MLCNSLAICKSIAPFYWIKLIKKKPKSFAAQLADIFTPRPAPPKTADYRIPQAPTSPRAHPRAKSVKRKKKGAKTDHDDREKAIGSPRHQQRTLQQSPPANSQPSLTYMSSATQPASSAASAAQSAQMALAGAAPQLRLRIQEKESSECNTPKSLTISTASASTVAHSPTESERKRLDGLILEARQYEQQPSSTSAAASAAAAAAMGSAYTPTLHIELQTSTPLQEGALTPQHGHEHVHLRRSISGGNSNSANSKVALRGSLSHVSLSQGSDSAGIPDSSTPTPKEHSARVSRAASLSLPLFTASQPHTHTVLAKPTPIAQAPSSSLASTSSSASTTAAASSNADDGASTTLSASSRAPVAITSAAQAAAASTSAATTRPSTIQNRTANRRLINAAINGSLLDFQGALNSGANIDFVQASAGKPAINAFTQALYYGHEQIIHALIDTNASPLILVNGKHIGVIDYVKSTLMKQKVQLTQNTMKKLEEYLATHQKTMGIYASLSHSAKVGSLRSSSSSSRAAPAKDEKLTPLDSLMRGAASGNLAQVEQALRDGADINGCVKTEGKYQTAFMVAVKHTKKAIIDFLILKQANPHLVSASGAFDLKSTVLEIAPDTTEDSLLQKLINYTIEQEKVNKEKAAKAAAAAKK